MVGWRFAWGLSLQGAGDGGKGGGEVAQGGVRE